MKSHRHAHSPRRIALSMTFLIAAGCGSSTDESPKPAGIGGQVAGGGKVGGAAGAGGASAQGGGVAGKSGSPAAGGGGGTSAAGTGGATVGGGGKPNGGSGGNGGTSGKAGGGNAAGAGLAGSGTGGAGKAGAGGTAGGGSGGGGATAGTGGSSGAMGGASGGQGGSAGAGKGSGGQSTCNCSVPACACEAQHPAGHDTLVAGWLSICVCPSGSTSCAAECGSACPGGPVSAACDACILNSLSGVPSLPACWEKAAVKCDGDPDCMELHNCVVNAAGAVPCDGSGAGGAGGASGVGGTGGGASGTGGGGAAGTGGGGASGTGGGGAAGTGGGGAAGTGGAAGGCGGVDLTTSPTDCGACGHGCLGGTCVASRCQPVVLSASEQHPVAMTIFAGALFWTNLGSTPPFADGAIRTLGLPTGVPSTIGDAQQGPMGLLATAAGVYAADHWGHEVRRIPPASATSTLTMSTPFKPIGIVAVGNDLYVAENEFQGAITTVPLSGGTRTVLVPNVPQAQRIATDGASLFYTSTVVGGGVYQTDLSGTSVTELAPGSNAFDVVYDGGTVFFTAGGTGADGFVGAVPAGGGPLVTLASALPSPLYLAVDAKYVYWTDGGSSGADGTVSRVPRTGGPIEVLATGLAQPQGIAIDGGAIYWAGYGDGTVRMLAKLRAGRRRGLVVETTPIADSQRRREVVWARSDGVASASNWPSSASGREPSDA